MQLQNRLSINRFRIPFHLFSSSINMFLILWAHFWSFCCLIKRFYGVIKTPLPIEAPCALPTEQSFRFTFCSTATHVRRHRRFLLYVSSLSPKFPFSHFVDAPKFANNYRNRVYRPTLSTSMSSSFIVHSSRYICTVYKRKTQSFPKQTRKRRNNYNSADY